MKKVVEDIFPKSIFNTLTKLHKLHNDLLFLPERIKLEAIAKLVANLHDQTECVIHIRSLK